VILVRQREEGGGKDHFEGRFRTCRDGESGENKIIYKWKRKSSSRNKHLVCSTFALGSGRRLALASSWIFKLVDRQNYDGFWQTSWVEGSRGLCPEKEATT